MSRGFHFPGADTYEKQKHEIEHGQKRNSGF